MSSRLKPPGTPTLIFGTGFLGTSTTFPTLEETRQLLTFLREQGITRIDTARRYPAISPGQAETLLGSAGAAGIDEKDGNNFPGFTIDTKLAILNGQPSGSLSPDNIIRSVEESYKALQMTPSQATSPSTASAKKSNKINILYPHVPDPTTPIPTSAQALQDLHTQDKFRSLGLSNATPAQIHEWHSSFPTSPSGDKIGPTTYQGQYNPLCRGAESIPNGILETCRAYSMSFNAYSPLAGGFLTGKATFSSPTSLESGSRFDPVNKMGAVHRSWYSDKPVMHAAVRQLQFVLDDCDGLSMAEASLRWLMHHSALGGGDGIILGGSTVEQIRVNVEAARKGELPEKVVEAFEEVWKMVEGEAPRV